MASTGSSDAKQGFIISQAKILGCDIGASLDWQQHIHSISIEDIPRPITESVLQKVNHGARKHYQIVFNSVAIDHVLTQINSLYTQGEIPNAVNPDDGILNGHIDLGDPSHVTSREYEWLLKDDVLITPRNIYRLPEDWPDETEGTEAERESYREMVSRLSTLAPGLANVKARHSQLLLLRSKLRALEQPLESLQPNLVTRDGELVSELNKTRILTARMIDALDSTTT